MEMVRLQAALRRRALVEEPLEYAPGHPNNAFVLADADAELDGGRVGVPPSVRWKTKEHAGPPRYWKCSWNVLTSHCAWQAVSIGSGGASRRGRAHDGQRGGTSRTKLDFIPR